jgi:hypothetical protein
MAFVMIAWACSPVHGQTLPGGSDVPSQAGAPRFPVPGKLPPSLLMPETPQSQIPAVKLNELTTFDSSAVQVRWNQGSYELHTGSVVLQNFGDNAGEAREAMRLIHALRLNARGTVGSPRPIMEYWLADGKAPTALSTVGMRTSPVDGASVRVDQVSGQWVVRDNDHILFNFGLGQLEAQQAAQAIRQYGFNRIGYIGHPKPLMIYFLAENRGAAPVADPMNPLQQTSFVPANKNLSVQETQRLQSLAALQAVQHLSRGYGQLAPATTEAALRIHFEPRHVKLHLDGQSWKLRYDNQDLGDFGKDFYQAQQVQQWLQQYGCTEMNQVGYPKTVLTYFLVNGGPPRGVKFSMSGRQFRTDLLTLKQIDQTWYLQENGQPILPLGTQQRDAERALQIIRRYGFDYIARPAGLESQTSFPFLIRTR